MKKHLYIIISSMMILFGSSFNILQMKGVSNYQIDTSKDVGDIPYETNVTPLGALVYTVPIACYPSPRGFQPNISLTYNSMSGVRTAGMGWSVGGISTISRVNSTNYYDGNIEPITFSDTSAFMLDGVRLVKRQNSDLLITEQGNILVKTRKSDYGRIIAFDVLYPNGNRATYEDLDNNPHKISYPITRMEDRLGNYIEYKYIQGYYRIGDLDPVGRGVYYISEIRYGANKQNKHYASIKFTYDSEREDPVRAYYAGMPYYDTFLLKEIRSYYNEYLFRAYILNHEFNDINNVNALAKIDCLTDNNALNPLKFAYGSKKEDKLEITKGVLSGLPIEMDSTKLILPIKFSSNKSANGLIYMASRSTFDFYSNIFNANGNVNGRRGSGRYSASNGRSEYTATNTKERAIIDRLSDCAYIYSDITDLSLQPSTIDIEGNFITQGENRIHSSFRGLLPIDFKGTGNKLLLRILEGTRNESRSSSSTSKPDNPDPNLSTLVFDSFNSDGVLVDSFQFSFPEKYVEAGTLGSSKGAISKSFLVGDFLGDGYESLLCITHNKDVNGDVRESRAILIDLNKKKVLYNQTCLGIGIEDILQVGDFDGDGRSDIYIIHKLGTDVYRFDTNSGLIKLTESLTYLLTPKLPEINESTGEPNGRILFADINADGKTDILSTAKYEDGEKWAVYVSNGETISLDLLDIGIDIDESLQLLSFNPDNEYLLQDVNGDGLPDFVVLDEHGQVSIHENIDGIHFTTTSKNIPDKFDSDSKLILTHVVEANKIHSIMGVIDGELALINNSVNRQENRMMSSSTNSYGVKTNYSYGTLTNKDICSVNEEKSLDFPYNYFVEDIYVLNNIETEYGGNSIFSKTYKYDSPVIHRHGLGFRGFEKVSVKNNLREEYTIQTFAPLKFGVLTDVKSSNMHITSEYDTLFAANKQVQVLLKKEVKKDLLKDLTSTSTFKYDSYGNLTERNIDLGEGIKSQTSYILENFDNNNAYLLGLPKEELQTNTRNGQSASSKSVTEYNNDLLPTNIKSYYNSHLVSEKSYQYDGLGNLKEAKVRSFNSPDWLATSYEYDDYGRKIKAIDPLGFTIEYLYEGRALLQAVKNHKGHTVRYDYDNWNRKVKTTYADGTTESIELAWDSSVSGAIYTSVSRKSGEPESKVYIDALGRGVRIGSQRFDGSYLYTEKEHDHLGRVKRESLPFKGSSPTLWNEYTYDTYDRIKSITYASGKKDAFAYNKLKVKSVIDGVETTKAYDAGGELIRITDASGSIVYNLRADGQPESIVAPGDIVTTFEYDKYGRQIAIIDPSAGTKTFEYDDAGNIQKDTDARGKVTIYKYDKYNRLFEKEIKDEFTTSYEYNTDNLLVKESSTNGTSKEFSYDRFFRLEKQKESIIDGKWFEQTLSYHLDGNIGSTDYKSHLGEIVTENYEYSNGHHTELKINNNQSIWKLIAENDQGMPIASKTGAIDREYSYDTYGLPTGRILKTDQDIIQDFRYKFDPKTGNLFWRKDNTRNIREDFAYDNLNRLTEFGDVTIQYNHLGNIIDHSSVGYFSYNQAKPYAMEIVEPYTQEISRHTQDIVYNAQMRPSSISENGYKALFTYDSNGNRIKMNLSLNDTLKLNRYYIGGAYEIDETLENTKERLYLGGDAYTAAAVLEKEGPDWKVSYIGRDYLGSITHVMDATGTVKQELSYDPWGRLRDPKTQLVYDVTKEMYPALAYRGYTGHEHLPMFGLINMNARLYDPVVGRFLSPDPYVQAPDFSQNFNRYSYALNNPLRYTDPNGEFLWVPILIAAAIGGTVNWVAHGAEFSWEGLAYFGVGATVGVAGYLTGGAAFTALAGSGAVIGTGGFVAGAGAGAVGFFGSTTTSMIGNSVIMGDPMPTPEDLAKGFTLSVVTGGIFNGTAAAMNGNNFWDGSISTVKPLPQLTSIDIERLSLNDVPKSSIDPTKVKMENVRKLGIEGEKAAGITGPKEKIPSLTGTATRRYPDQLIHPNEELGIWRGSLTEVKNVSYLRDTYQLKDFRLYSQQKGYDMYIITRSNTVITPPLRTMMQFEGYVGNESMFIRWKINVTQ